jgi:hypothetical protein
MLLQGFDKSDNWEESGKRQRECNRTHHGCSLPENDATDAEHLEIVRISLSLRKCLRVCVNDSNQSAAEIDCSWLNVRSLQVPMTTNAEVVENHPGSVRPVERVEMNTGNFIFKKILALLQCVLGAHAPDRLRIILAGL